MLVFCALMITSTIGSKGTLKLCHMMVQTSEDIVSLTRFFNKGIFPVPQSKETPHLGMRIGKRMLFYFAFKF